MFIMVVESIDSFSSFLVGVGGNFSLDYRIRFCVIKLCARLSLE